MINCDTCRYQFGRVTDWPCVRCCQVGVDDGPPIHWKPSLMYRRLLSDRYGTYPQLLLLTAETGISYSINRRP